MVRLGIGNDGEEVMLYYGDGLHEKSIRELAQSDQEEDKILLNYYR